MVRLEIDTFADLHRDPAPLAAWFGELFATLLVPLCPASVGELVTVARDYSPSDTTPWGPPGYARLRLGNGDFTVSGWSRGLDRLSHGTSDFLRVWLVRLDAQGLPARGDGWSAEVLLKDDPEFPHQIVVTAARSVFGGWISRVVQQDWLRALSSGSALTRAVHGWITLDGVGVSTAHEMVTRTGIDDALLNVVEHARGYHWATLLGPRQVAALGGVERVCVDAPCASVEHLGGGRVLLRLTDDLEEVSDDDLRELKAFLLPVLLRTDNQPYRGHPVRFV